MNSLIGNITTIPETKYMFVERISPSNNKIFRLLQQQRQREINTMKSNLSSHLGNFKNNAECRKVLKYFDNKNVNWNRLIMNEDLSEHLILTYINHIDLEKLLIFQKLSESCINKLFKLFQRNNLVDLLIKTQNITTYLLYKFFMHGNGIKYWRFLIAYKKINSISALNQMIHSTKDRTMVCELKKYYNIII